LFSAAIICRFCSVTYSLASILLSSIKSITHCLLFAFLCVSSAERDTHPT
jgi:hypothetical protein